MAKKQPLFPSKGKTETKGQEPKGNKMTKNPFGKKGGGFPPKKK